MDQVNEAGFLVGHVSSIRSRYSAGLFLLATTFLLAVSCSPDPGDEVEVTVNYQDIAELGFIDQMVLLQHGSDSAIVPTMQYVPLDVDGSVVTGVDVSTVYGSDQGQLVVTPDGEVDILVFTGDRVAEVVGATGTAIEIVELDKPGVLLSTEPQAIIDGTEVLKFEAFDEVGFTNESLSDVTIRIVCILWSSPDIGEAQQAEKVDVVVERTTVLAGETLVMEVSSEFTERVESLGFGCGSLKAHLTP